MGPHDLSQSPACGTFRPPNTLGFASRSKGPEADTVIHYPRYARWMATGPLPPLLKKLKMTGARTVAPQGKGPRPAWALDPLMRMTEAQLIRRDGATPSYSESNARIVVSGAKSRSVGRAPDGTRCLRIL